MHYAVCNTVLLLRYCLVYPTFTPGKNHLALSLSSHVRYVLICLARLEIAIPEQSYGMV